MCRSLIIIFVFFPLLLTAQGRNTFLSFEVGGSGINASVNIAQTVIEKECFKIVAQSGVGLVPKTALSEYKIDFPAQLTCNFGREGLYFEAGVGSTIIFKSNMGNEMNQTPENELYMAPIIGFRHESERWFGRVYACPLFHVTENSLYDDVTKDFIKIGVGIGLIF